MALPEPLESISSPEVLRSVLTGRSVFHTEAAVDMLANMTVETIEVSRVNGPDGLEPRFKFRLRDGRTLLEKDQGSNMLILVDERTGETVRECSLTTAA